MIDKLGLNEHIGDFSLSKEKLNACRRPFGEAF
jgi:hypothetical protein